MPDKQEIGQKTTPEEMDVIKSVPAIYVNAFAVGNDGEGIRLTLAEGATTKRSRIRGAYFMSFRDAHSLSRLLLQYLQMPGDLMERDREGVNGPGSE